MVGLGLARIFVSVEDRERGHADIRLVSWPTVEAGRETWNRGDTVFTRN